MKTDCVKKALTLLLALLLLAGLVSCKKGEEEVPGEQTVFVRPATDVENFKPVLRFAVTSDIHIADLAANGDVGPGRLAKLFDTAYRYSTGNADHGSLDALLVAGDFTDDGTPAQLAEFFRIVNEKKKPETSLLAVMGNHEYYTANAVNNMLSASGYENINLHRVICGYHFIGVSPDQNGQSFSQSSVTYLQTELQKAANDDPTGKKPIFVFHHQPVSDTVYGSKPWAGHTELSNVLKKYPQVVDFAGHSHFPISDPASISQKDFTALGTGSLRYCMMGISGTNLNAMVFPTTHDGAWDCAWKNNRWVSEENVEWGERNTAAFYLIEVDAYGNLKVQCYDLLSDTFMYDPILIDSVGYKDRFTFTSARGAASEKPYFAENDALTVQQVTSTLIKIQIPQASCADNVQNYRCELYEGTEKIQVKYRLSGTFSRPIPESVMLPFDALTPNTEYTVKVFPVNSYGKAGNPLLLNVSTTDAPAAGTLPTADLFSVSFNADGSATDLVSDTTLSTSGNPTTATGKTADTYAGVFDGSSDYRFSGVTEFYESMDTAATVEVCFRADETPASGSVGIFANHELGGFGFEYREDGMLIFNYNIMGTDQTVAADVESGQYVHAVVTYDGDSLRLYINGVRKSMLDYSGDMRLPISTAQYLCIGGNSDRSDSAPRFNGTILCANIYSSALSRSQVELLANQYK